MLYSVLNSKQKQLHGHKSNKMCESTLSWIGNFEEKIDLSHIYLAVLVMYNSEEKVKNPEATNMLHFVICCCGFSSRNSRTTAVDGGSV